MVVKVQEMLCILGNHMEFDTLEFKILENGI